jgi:hypothetical protein
MLFVLPLFGGAALAYEFVVYPAQGQSEEQTEQDKFTCYSWAEGQTGFDPMQMRKPHPRLNPREIKV